jgi:hypothetical protein
MRMALAPRPKPVSPTDLHRHLGRLSATMAPEATQGPRTATAPAADADLERGAEGVGTGAAPPGTATPSVGT